MYCLTWLRDLTKPERLHLFKTHRCSPHRNREEETKGSRSVQNKKSQANRDTDRQINHITESQGITGRSFGVFTSNSQDDVCPLELLHYQEFLILFCTCTNKNKLVENPALHIWSKLRNALIPTVVKLWFYSIKLWSVLLKLWEVFWGIFLRQRWLMKSSICPLSTK